LYIYIELKEREKEKREDRRKELSFERMPKVRRGNKPPPEGWELIEPTLREIEQKVRDGKDRILFLHSFLFDNNFIK